MRKYSGCFLLIFSFLIVIVASITAIEIDCEKSKLWTNAAFNPEIKYKLDHEQRIAIAAFVVGIVMFIVGLIIVMSRTKDKKRYQ